jgi:hypothetical protein
MLTSRKYAIVVLFTEPSSSSFRRTCEGDRGNGGVQHCRTICKIRLTPVGGEAQKGWLNRRLFHFSPAIEKMFFVHGMVSLLGFACMRMIKRLQFERTPKHGRGRGRASLFC